MPLFYDVFMRWPLPVICLSSLAASSIFWSLHMQRTPQSRIIGYIGSLNLPAQKDMTWASRHASPLCNAECPRHKARQWPEARHQQWHSAGSRWSENTLKRSSLISEKKRKQEQWIQKNAEHCALHFALSQGGTREHLRIEFRLWSLDWSVLGNSSGIMSAYSAPGHVIPSSACCKHLKTTTLNLTLLLTIVWLLLQKRHR